MKQILRLLLGYTFVAMCPFLLGGIISMVVFGPWAVLIEAIVWMILFESWFDGSRLQYDL